MGKTLRLSRTVPFTSLKNTQTISIESTRIAIDRSGRNYSSMGRRLGLSAKWNSRDLGICNRQRASNAETDGRSVDQFRFLPIVDSEVAFTGCMALQLNQQLSKHWISADYYWTVIYVRRTTHIVEVDRNRKFYFWPKPKVGRKWRNTFGRNRMCHWK